MAFKDSKKDEDLENSVHWAFVYAKKVIEKFPNKEKYVVASGITPSGMVHVGHFREIITTELVRRALEKLGKKTEFIYSWDSYDAFRKVPLNIPKEWEKYLRMPLSKIPDFEGCHESYAEHWMQKAEETLSVFNFPIKYQRQHKLQTSGIYANGIKKFLNRLDEIKKILNKYKEKPLPEDWFPLSLYCEKCNKDTTKIIHYDGNYNVSYKCKCGFENEINFKEKPIVKLLWRLDWPMRWDFYDVNFEPSGKDHGTTGGSYDTSKEIIKLVTGKDAPVSLTYNLVKMHGENKKISSSTGKGLQLNDLLEVYTPEMILFLFASTRPQAEIEISLDLDIIKNYEEFDKLERVYYDVEEEQNEKKRLKYKKIYELSKIEGKDYPKELPFQPSFRLLLNISQAKNFDFEKVKEFYKDEIKTEFDEERLKERFERVKNWLEKYAPDRFKFKFVDKPLYNKEDFDNKIISLFNDLRIFLENKKTKDLTNEEIINFVKSKIIIYNLDIKDFFKAIYRILINKESGPKLTNLIIDNREKVLEILNYYKNV